MALIFMVAVAHAQDAKSLKAAGDAAMDRLDFQVAFDNYTKAYELSREPALIYNRARALQSLNRMPEAVDELERFEREAPPELKAKVPQLQQMLSDFRARVGSLTVRTPVSGARVIVDNKDVGKTPLPDKVRLNAGRVKVEVVAEGYEPYSTMVDVTPAGAVVEATLVGRSTVLVVRADPQATSSLLDGVVGGGTPFERNVKPGKHVLVLKRDGFYDLTAETALEAGDRKVLDLKLEGKPVTTKWWFWTTVVGAVVVAAVVVPLAIAYSIERSPDTGDIPPGRVPAP